MTKKMDYAKEIEPEILNDLKVLDQKVDVFKRKANECEIDAFTIDSLAKIAQIHDKYTTRRYLKHGSEASEKFNKIMDKFSGARFQLTEKCICKSK